MAVNRAHTPYTFSLSAEIRVSVITWPTDTDTPRQHREPREGNGKRDADKLVCHRFLYHPSPSPALPSPLPPLCFIGSIDIECPDECISLKDDCAVTNQEDRLGFVLQHWGQLHSDLLSCCGTDMIFRKGPALFRERKIERRRVNSRKVNISFVTRNM